MFNVEAVSARVARVILCFGSFSEWGLFTIMHRAQALLFLPWYFLPYVLQEGNTYGKLTLNRNLTRSTSICFSMSNIIFTSQAITHHVQVHRHHCFPSLHCRVRTCDRPCRFFLPEDVLQGIESAKSLN